MGRIEILCRKHTANNAATLAMISVIGGSIVVGKVIHDFFSDLPALGWVLGILCALFTLFIGAFLSSALVILIGLTEPTTLDKYRIITKASLLVCDAYVCIVGLALQNAAVLTTALFICIGAIALTHKELYYGISSTVRTYRRNKRITHLIKTEQELFSKIHTAQNRKKRSANPKCNTPSCNHALCHDLRDAQRAHGACEEELVRLYRERDKNFAARTKILDKLEKPI